MGKRIRPRGKAKKASANDDIMEGLELKLQPSGWDKVNNTAGARGIVAGYVEAKDYDSLARYLFSIGLEEGEFSLVGPWRWEV